jgi:hypothetical protein
MQKLDKRIDVVIDREDDVNIRSECEIDKGIDCEDGDSDTDG